MNLPAHPSQKTDTFQGIANNGRVATAKKGIAGYVLETEQTFAIWDDYEYALPPGYGKGYHVKVQLGNEAPRAYISLQPTSPRTYEQICQMIGERCLNDGEEGAARWYVKRDDPATAKVRYQPR